MGWEHEVRRHEEPLTGADRPDGPQPFQARTLGRPASVEMKGPRREPMQTTNDIVQKLWNLCSLLREDGVTYPQYVRRFLD